jgi:hypothetical protein
MPFVEWLNSTSLELPIQGPRITLKGVELFNLTADIANCCPAFDAPRTDHDVEDFNGFGVLSLQFVEASNDIDKQVSTKS